MKKIFTVLVMALAMSLAFTGCASKKANAKGPTTYRINLGAAMSTIELGEEKTAINVTSLLPEGAKPVAGETVKVMWTFASDEDIGKIYVSCGDASDEYVLVEDVEAGNTVYVVQSIPLELDIDGPFYVYVWSDTSAVCEVAFVDAK